MLFNPLGFENSRFICCILLSILLNFIENIFWTNQSIRVNFLVRTLINIVWLYPSNPFLNTPNYLPPLLWIIINSIQLYFFDHLISTLLHWNFLYMLTLLLQEIFIIWWFICDLWDLGDLSIWDIGQYDQEKKSKRFEYLHFFNVIINKLY